MGVMFISLSLWASEISIERENGKLIIKAGDDLFTQYIYKDEKRSKPILYPIIGPDSKPMTRKFPMEEPGDGEEQDQGGELVIHDPRVNANRGFDLNKFKHFFSPIEHTPSTGDVLIMPGYVYHSVRQFHSSLRMAVPVDIFIKDN